MILAAAAGLMVLLACGWISGPVYRSEALRFEARRKIDAIAAGRISLDAAVPPAVLKFQEAVKVMPQNGRAWGDLSYATALSWHVTHGNGVVIGQRAESAARRALELCPINAEFWVHQGVALDMQGRSREAGESFQRALALAPNNPEWHYHYAHHLSALPDRKSEAKAAVETCLALDPSNRQAEALLTRLTGAR
jgi:Flp pilus assembly protein TadD